MSDTSQLLIYQTPEGNIKIDVRLEDETVWLTQAQMAALFGKSRTTITEHIQNVFKEGELRTSFQFHTRKEPTNGQAIQRTLPPLRAPHRRKNHRLVFKTVASTQPLRQLQPEPLSRLPQLSNEPSPTNQLLPQLQPATV